MSTPRMRPRWWQTAAAASALCVACGSSRPPAAMSLDEQRAARGGDSSSASGSNDATGGGPSSDGGSSTRAAGGTVAAGGSTIVRDTLDPTRPLETQPDYNAYADGLLDPDHAYAVGALDGNLKKRVLCRVNRTNEVAGGFPEGVTQAYIEPDGHVVYLDADTDQWWRWVPDDMTGSDDYPADPTANDEPVDAPAPRATLGNCGDQGTVLEYADGGASLCGDEGTSTLFTWNGERTDLFAGDTYTKDPATTFAWTDVRPSQDGSGFLVMDFYNLYHVAPDGETIRLHEGAGRPIGVNMPKQTVIARDRYFVQYGQRLEYNGLLQPILVNYSGRVAESYIASDASESRLCHAYIGFAFSDDPP